MRLLSHPAHLNMLLHYLLLKFPDSANCQACVFHPCSQEFRLRQSSIRGKFHSPLPGKGKALAWAGVPSSLCKQLSAGEWVKGPLAALGGQGRRQAHQRPGPGTQH